ncbi:hypothetical protein BV898_17667 [Hypsibius exemplaris]|uniref:DOMON domain-containing protein n=1 Tax=Hypsibius exemplaris TaxID=2072580 RepID=A0A9X6NFI4_HYPEX|nr:hypothetical protein BV898_17667 [Hypsibius exemplaris]
MSFLQSTLVLFFVVSALVVMVRASPAAARLTCGTAGTICYGLPSGCLAHGPTSCDVLAKVQPAPGSMIHVELTATPTGSMKLHLVDRWIAVGFSENGRMENSPVVHCFEEHGKAVAKLTHNGDEYQNEGWSHIDQSQLSAKQLLADGHTLSCNVDVKTSLHLNKDSADLSATKHALIVATGPMHNGAIAVHDQSPAASFPSTYAFHA